MCVPPNLIRPCVLFGWKEEEGWDERQKDAAIALRPRWMNQVAPRSCSFLLIINTQKICQRQIQPIPIVFYFIWWKHESSKLILLKRTWNALLSNGWTAKYRTLTNISTCCWFSGIKSRDCALYPAEKFLENFELLRHTRLMTVAIWSLFRNAIRDGDRTTI